jgi:hypothetical protein
MGLTRQLHGLSALLCYNHSIWGVTPVWDDGGPSALEAGLYFIT